jgi:dienelactone hydrolase
MKTPIFRLIAVLITGLPTLVASARAMTEQERRDYLQWMYTSLPSVPASTGGYETFEQWQKRTGELPPDFDALPRNNFMPDPLVFLDGKPVRTAADWEKRKAEIKQLYQQYIVGTMPPKAKLFKSTVTSETPGEGYTTRVVELTYGPEVFKTTTAGVTLVVPNGKGPFPVLIGGTPASLLRRGYISVAITNYSVDATLPVAGLYPGYDFASMAQMSFIIQTVVDYLHTVPEVDKGRIALTGYSRLGRMSVLAAAMEERITALVAGSAGIGGTTPWRLGGEYGSGEGLESYTRGFPRHFPPRLRFFAGHEDRLPVDSNLLAAIIAPRSMLIQYGLNDEVANTWAVERTYDSALKVFSLLKVPDRLGLLRVPGFHGSNDVEAYLDWLDIQFGRSSAKWDNKLMFSYTRADWLKKSGEKIDLRKYPVKANDHLLAGVAGPADWEKKAENVRAAINWMLGEKPLAYVAAPRGGVGAGGARGAVPGRGAAPAGRGAAPAGPNPGQLGPDVPAWVIARGGNAYGWVEPGRSLAAQRPLAGGFSYNGVGTIYYPSNTPEGTKLPVAIWLHGYSYPLGYMWVYRSDTHPILALVNAGYAVLAYDQVGFGSRMKDFQSFYDRTPHWSLMGQMVEDVRKAVDALANDPGLDPNRISVFGYSIGGTVGLYAAALDPRITSVVSVSGFTPMRTDTASRGLGGIARYSDERGLLPRLGFFIGNEARIPYDFPELIASIAPRSVLIVEPTMDRAGSSAEVRSAVLEARQVYALYNASDKLALDEPEDYVRLTNATQNRAVQWMNAIHRPAPVPFTPAAPPAP